MNRIGVVRTAAITGLAAALGLAAAVPAMAAPGADPVTTVADLDGDGEIETVNAQLAGEDDQLISATVDGTYASIHLPADSRFGIQARRSSGLPVRAAGRGPRLRDGRRRERRRRPPGRPAHLLGHPHRLHPSRRRLERPRHGPVQRPPGARRRFRRLRLSH
ncbi:hypothetical protein [Amycolatopsis camponoti]|nr:hypothetical protein [Amycolatopsis camponoti]